MSSNRQAKRDRARDYILAHPDDSKEVQARESGCSIGTIAIVRAELIKERKLRPSRKSTSPFGPPPGPAPAPSAPSTPAAGAMLDHAAMTTLNEIMDAVESGQMSDDEIAKKLLSQCVRFAFDIRLHADTRMSASNMWSKLKDQQKSRSLGPGSPMDFETAVTRLSDLMIACGPEITVAAVHRSFESRGPNEGTLPSNEGTDARSAPGDAPASISEPLVHTDDGPTGPLALG